MRLGEINIICTNGAESLKFYRDILGFQFLEEEEGCYHLEFSGVRFLLLPIASAPSRSLPYGSSAAISFDLLVDSIVEVKAIFKQNGVSILRENSTASKSMHITDPDGNVIEVIEARATP